MNNNLTDILAACLEKLDQNEITLEEVLNLYPEAREELEPLLRTANTLRDNSLPIRSEFKRNSPARLQNSLPDRKKPSSLRSIFQTQKHFPNKLALGLSAVIGFVFIFFLGSGTVYASSNSIPGDVLYPLKLAVEDVRLFIANDQKDMQLQMEYLQTRLNEIDQLINEDRSEDLVLAQETYIETLENATAVLKENSVKENKEKESKFAEYKEYLSNQTEVISELINSVPSQAQPALQNILEKTKKNQNIINEILTGNETSEDNKAKPEKTKETITPEVIPTMKNETPEPTDKTNNGKNEDKNNKSALTASVTQESPEKEKTKNTKIPTKKTK